LSEVFLPAGDSVHEDELRGGVIFEQGLSCAFSGDPDTCERARSGQLSWMFGPAGVAGATAPVPVSREPFAEQVRASGIH
jgi:hypothetical protein